MSVCYSCGGVNKGAYTMTMKAFKAAFFTGAKLAVLDHWQEKLRGTTRTVQKVQGNGYWFFTDDVAGTFFAGQPKSWRLKFVECGAT